MKVLFPIAQYVDGWWDLVRKVNHMVLFSVCKTLIYSEIHKHKSITYNNKYTKIHHLSVKHFIYKQFSY